MFTVALIGIGNISLLNDDNFDDTNIVKSHLKAIYTHKEFQLKYVVDINPKHFSNLQKSFKNILCITDYKELLVKKDIDILVLATPTSTHFEILNYLQHNKNIQLFFIEKPLFNSSLQYEQFQTNFKEKLVINYIRRFDNTICELKNNITTQNDTAQKIVINYCKGLKNNGSHMIDLINFLFSNPKILSYSILSKEKGFDEQDPNYDIYLTIESNGIKIPVYFLGFDHHLYNFIELNLYFSKQFIRYTNHKQEIEYFHTKKDNFYKDYIFLEKEATIKKLNNKTLFYDTYENLYCILRGSKKNPSTYEDELNNRIFLNTILQGVNICQN